MIFHLLQRNEFYYQHKHDLDLKREVRKASRKRGGGGYGKTPPAVRTSSAPSHIAQSWLDDPDNFVVPTNREGMRARPRNFSYAETGGTSAGGAPAAGASEAPNDAPTSAPSGGGRQPTPPPPGPSAAEIAAMASSGSTTYRWSEAERARLSESVATYGLDNWQKVAEMVGT